MGHGTLLPGVGVADSRVGVDVRAMPWRGVVRVQTELGGRCTGFLVAPRVAITAAHCVAALPGGFIRAGSVHVLAGYRDGSFTGQAVAVTMRGAAGYDWRREDATAGADWVVLVLSAPLGSAADVLPLGRGEVPAGTVVTLGGYGRDRAERLEADPHCLVLGPAADGGGRPLLRHGCAATQGTSGAPLLARDGAGWRVVGVEIAAERQGVGGMAVPLRDAGAIGG